MTFDKFTDARISRDSSGLMWIESDERVNEGSAEEGSWYTFWLLVQPSTDRVMVVIDGPTKHQMSYGVGGDGINRRTFLTIDGAKRWAVTSAMTILDEERRELQAKRQNRRMVKAK